MKKITEKRKELGLTQKQVAKQLGVRVATISDFETGKTSMGTDLFIKYLNLLDLDICDRVKCYNEAIADSKKRYSEAQKRIEAIDRKLEAHIKDMADFKTDAFLMFSNQNDVNDKFTNLFKTLKK